MGRRKAVTQESKELLEQPDEKEKIEEVEQIEEESVVVPVKIAETKATKLHYDEDKEQVVAKKTMPKKLRLLLEHFVFFIIVVALSVVLTMTYYYTTKTDLDDYYVVGSYTIVALERVYPNDYLDRANSNLSISRNSVTHEKTYLQEIEYNFNENSTIKIDDAYSSYLLELQKPVNGFGITDSGENYKELCHQEKDVIKLRVEKGEKKIKITVSYITSYNI